MEEIKSRCESLSGIFQKKGFKEWFISFFSSFSYMQNVIDMVVETYSSKIEQFLKMIENKSIQYLEIIINKINHYINASKIDFNENQKEKWKKLCDLYEKTKTKILEIEKK
jgi:F0F1-type ATP synthase delta subunit